MKKVLFIILCLVPLLISCNHNRIIFDHSKYDLQDIKNRIVFIIHGDGSYLYHDQNGNALYADETALKYAVETARSLPNSEVFIYHLKKKEHFLFFFPKDDRDFYYFRNEKLINKNSYSSDANFLNPESEFLEDDHEKNNLHHQINNYFFYYGHEIPQSDGAGYFNSFPDRKFNIDSLANQLKKFTDIFTDQFQLIVLSTCNSGNPYSIYKILPYSRYILASPGDLHLSYIDCRGLTETLQSDKSLGDKNNDLASKAFDSLCMRTKTLVALSLYNNSLVMPELESYFKYNISHPTVQTEANNSDFVDCSDNQKTLLSSDIEKGTKVYYRPPLFGKMKNKKNHSGWGCYNNSNDSFSSKKQ